MNISWRQNGKRKKQVEKCKLEKERKKFLIDRNLKASTAVVVVRGILLKVNRGKMRRVYRYVYVKCIEREREREREREIERERERERQKKKKRDG
uniref:Uncharacterized protein n=1 Tax=Octopus bimaculoides TaxID=37653 RepID=A0A0L8HXB4_OCTBM